jgi:hypothetical protein
MRVDLGDYVMLRPAAVETLLHQGYDVEGLIAEVVDGRTVPDGYDLTLKFDGIKTLITQVPVQFVQHVAVS